MRVTARVGAGDWDAVLWRASGGGGGYRYAVGVLSGGDALEDGHQVVQARAAAQVHENIMVISYVA